MTVSVIKRCLLIGINYRGTPAELNGCINDSENIKQFLITNNYFNENEMIIMNEDQKDDLIPIKQNILKQFNELVNLANLNKSKKVNIFLSYSGHGSYIRDINGDEGDGKDEAICPLDYDASGFIIDDDLRKLFVNKLHKNVRLFCIFDSCHSGTVLDLKYNYLLDKKNSYKVCTTVPVSQCQVVMISGCKDNQTSADAYIIDDNTKLYEYQGAMTASFISNYKSGISYLQLIKNMREWLKKEEYTQIPQLSSGKQITVTAPILLNYFC